MASKFQHRHYAAIADVLANARESVKRDYQYQSRDQLEAAQTAVTTVEALLLTVFRRDNGGFDAERFRKAARRAPDMHGKDKVA
jgi:hypothetical protein